MNRNFMEKEEAIKLLQKQSLEVFMGIMKKLLSDDNWSSNGDFINFITKKRRPVYVQKQTAGSNITVNV